MKHPLFPFFKTTFRIGVLSALLLLGAYMGMVLLARMFREKLVSDVQFMTQVALNGHKTPN